MSTTKSGKRIVAILVAIAMAFTLMAVQTNTASAKSKKPKYKIYINTKRCLATVYKKKGLKWKPFRCMNCCAGKSSTPSPQGTYRLGGKWKWFHMAGRDYNVFVRYAIHVTGDYFLHSCCYNVGTNPRKEYSNQIGELGTHRTHGCIRFSVTDAKWIYNNKSHIKSVTLTRSSKHDKLGRPTIRTKNKYKKKRNWDPTDPNRKNKNYNMKGPRISFAKNKPDGYIYGYKGPRKSLKYGVKAINPYADQDLTSKVKIKKCTRTYKGKTTKISGSSFSTKKLGTYHVTYWVTDKYCLRSDKVKKGVSKNYTVKVYDNAKLKGVKSRTVSKDATNAVSGVKATCKSDSKLTSKIKVTIKAPDGSSKTLSYDNAKAYAFSQSGKYKITYSVNSPYAETAATKTVKKTATITVK